MRIDLPQCGLHQCRYQFDGNCKSKDKYKLCEFVNERQQWIPCSERLPEYGEYVLVTFIDQSVIDTKVMCVRRIEGVFDWYWSDFADEYTWEASEVIAWMSCPEPWKEDNNAD